jgi:hypothetical protein
VATAAAITVAGDRRASVLLGAAVLLAISMLA